MKLFTVASTLLSLTALRADGNPVASHEPNRSAPRKNPVLISGERPADGAKVRAAQPARTDFYGDPLPPGAVARLGTLRDNIGKICSDVVLSPDGKTVTATSTFYAIPLNLWDTATGRVVLELKELDPLPYLDPDNESFGSVALAPDGAVLAAASGNGAERLWDTATGELRGRLEGAAGFTSELAFAPDGKSLAATAGNGTTLIWAVPSARKP